MRVADVIDGGGEPHHGLGELEPGASLSLHLVGGLAGHARHLARLADQLPSVPHLLDGGASHVIHLQRHPAAGLGHRGALQLQALGLLDRGLHGGEGALGDGADLHQRPRGPVSELHAHGGLLPALLHERHGGDDRLAHAGDHGGDLPRGARGALGQPADLIGHHAEGAPVLAGLRGDDGGVERQQLRLVGDLLDDVDDAADLRGAHAERVDELGRLAHRLLDSVHALDAVVDQLLAALGGGRHGQGELVRLAGAAAHGVDAGAHHGDEALGLVGEARQLVTGDGDVRQPLAHGLHQLAGVVGELVEDGEGLAHLLEPLGHLRQGARGLVGERCPSAPRAGRWPGGSRPCW